MRPLPLLARAARGAPASQQAQMADDREAVPFVVPLPRAATANGGGASARSVIHIPAYRLGRELAMQHGEVVFKESALGPLIGKSSCTVQRLVPLLGNTQEDVDKFRRWNGVKMGKVQAITDGGARTLCMLAGTVGGETAEQRLQRWDAALGRTIAAVEAAEAAAAAMEVDGAEDLELYDDSAPQLPHHSAVASAVQTRGSTGSGGGGGSETARASPGGGGSSTPKPAEGEAVGGSAGGEAAKAAGAAGTKRKDDAADGGGEKKVKCDGAKENAKAALASLADAVKNVRKGAETGLYATEAAGWLAEAVSTILKTDKPMPVFEGDSMVEVDTRMSVESAAAAAAAAAAAKSRMTGASPASSAESSQPMHASGSLAGSQPASLPNKLIYHILVIKNFIGS